MTDINSSGRQSNDLPNSALRVKCWRVGGRFFNSISNSFTSMFKTVKLDGKFMPLKFSGNVMWRLERFLQFSVPFDTHWNGCSSINKYCWLSPSLNEVSKDGKLGGDDGERILFGSDSCVRVGGRKDK